MRHVVGGSGESTEVDRKIEAEVAENEDKRRTDAINKKRDTQTVSVGKIRNKDNIKEENEAEEAVEIRKEIVTEVS